MNNLADRIFVINLDHRTDRLERFLNELQREGITNWERFDAIKYDPKIHGHEAEFNKFVVSKEEKYRKAAFGCMLSHYFIIKIAKSRGYKSVIILEDDFLFTDGWRANLDKCMDELKDKAWLFFYFHVGYYAQNAWVPVSDNIVVPRMGLGTTGYLVKQEMYDWLLKEMLTHGIQIDVFYYQKIQNNPLVLAPKKSIIIQGESYSDLEFSVSNKNGLGLGEIKL
jgi:GR25 family glycosyltransferase involved in LPS biosynthesis